MKILLISPSNCDLVHAVSVPLGLLSIGTYLKKRKHKVKILDLCVSRQSVREVLEEFEPDLCGVSVRSTKQVSSALNISKTIHKKGIPVIWGGPFCSYAPIEHFFDTGVIDILSFSEGEITWIELADAFENCINLEKIKGIAFKKEGKIIKTPEREFMDLNEILPADWSLVDIPKYFQYLYGANKLLYLYLSKGCPGNCTFCYNNVFHRSCHRRKSVDIFSLELKELVEEYGLDGFYLADEMAFFKKSDLYDLCGALDKTGYNLLWGFQSRIGALNKEDFQRAYDSGCRWVDFGIESGSKRMLSVINKNIPFGKIETTFDWCKEIGIISMANFIIGFPGETVDDLQETVSLAKRILVTQPTFFLYGYNYGSEIGKELYGSGKYKLPKKLWEYSKIDLFYNRLPNFSDIPTWDKKVIQGYFLWQQLSKEEYSKESKRFELFYKHIKTVLNRISYCPVLRIPEAIVKSFFPYVRFFFAAKFCKKTLEKYGLE